MRSRRSLLSLVVSIAVLAVTSGFMLKGMISATEAANNIPDLTSERLGVTQGGDVLIVGDSLTVGAVSAGMESILFEQMTDSATADGLILMPGEVVVKSAGGAGAGHGASMLAAADLDDFDQIVIALGTSDYGHAEAEMVEAVDETMAEADGLPVLWVNVDAGGPSAEPAARMNRVLAAAEVKHSNLTVADWNSYIDGHPDVEKLRTGGIDYIADTYLIRAQWLSEAIAELDA